ncbi:hypothetical protein THAOC_03229, partial [Thalassiosira oceanica]
MVGLEAQANPEGPGADEEDNPSLDDPARIPDDTKEEKQNPEAVAHDHDDPTAKRSINSHYPARVGILQTLSLVLNAGLM